MNTKTKVNIKNVLAGVGAGALVIILSAFAITSFRGSQALDATVIRSSNSNLDSDSIRGGNDAQLRFVKEEVPFTGEIFEFSVRNDLTGEYLSNFSLIGDGREENFDIYSGTQYTITELSQKSGKNYNTSYRCGDDSGFNDRINVQGKSVSITTGHNQYVFCRVKNIYCPPDTICGVETKTLPYKTKAP